MRSGVERGAIKSCGFARRDSRLARQFPAYVIRTCARTDAIIAKIGAGGQTIRANFSTMVKIEILRLRLDEIVERVRA